MKTRLESRWLALGAFLAGSICIAITALMNRHFGASQGVDDEARWLLSASSVVTDVAGLVLFGLLAGALYRARQWGVGSFVLLIMLACAGYSIVSVSGFVANQRLSVQAAREAQQRRAEGQRKAILDAAKERRGAQARLAAEQLEWMRGTRSDTRGRQSRRDLLDAAGKVIAQVGEGEDAIPLPDGPAEVAMRPDAQAELWAKATGYSQSAIQLSIMLYGSILLIVIKCAAFPLASYVWPRKPPRFIDADYRDAPPPPFPPLPAAEAAPGLPPPTQPAAGPEIISSAAQQPEAAESLPSRMPLAGSETSLIEIGFPLGERPPRKREKSQPREAAERFVTWLRAFDLVREPLTDEDVTRLYAEFCEADFRAPTAENLMRGELNENVRGVLRHQPRQLGDDGKIKRPVRWKVTRGKYPPPDTNPKQEGAKVFALPRPLAVPASEPAPIRRAA